MATPVALPSANQEDSSFGDNHGDEELMTHQSRNEDEHLSALMERIYDAAIDSSCWPAALESTCAFVTGCSASIFCQKGLADPVTVSYTWGDNPIDQQRYVQFNAAMNPSFPASDILETGKVYTLNDIMPLRDFKEIRLFIELMKQQGILDVMYCNLERTSTGTASIAIYQREVDNLFEDNAKRRFRLVVPHIRRAISIENIIDFHCRSADELAMAINGLSLAVILLRRDGEIVFANDPAKDAMREGSILRKSAQQKLIVNGHKANKELQEALLAAESGDRCLGTKGITIRLNDDSQKPQVAHVLSMKSGRSESSIKGRATVAVFVKLLIQPKFSSLEIMARLYKLTPCETRILEATFGKGSTCDIAGALGLSLATVKTHLNHLYSKTETSRRNELVQLATGFASPLADGR